MRFKGDFPEEIREKNLLGKLEIIFLEFHVIYFLGMKIRGKSSNSTPCELFLESPRPPLELNYVSWKYRICLLHSPAAFSMEIVADENHFPQRARRTFFFTNLNGKCWHDSSSFKHDSEQIFYVLALKLNCTKVYSRLLRHSRSEPKIKEAKGASENYLKHNEIVKVVCGVIVGSKVINP